MRCYNCGHLRRSHVKILQYIIFLFHIFSCFNVYFYQNFVHIAATDFWLFLLFFFVCRWWWPLYGCSKKNTQNRNVYSRNRPHSHVSHFFTRQIFVQQCVTIQQYFIIICIIKKPLTMTCSLISHCITEHLL